MKKFVLVFSLSLFIYSFRLSSHTPSTFFLYLLSLPSSCAIDYTNICCYYCVLIIIFISTVSLPGSFDVNYDYTTGKAITPLIPIGEDSGIQCKECYLYFGAFFGIIVEYSSSFGFAFEAETYGGAGFKIDLSVINPKITKPITKQLFPAQPSAVTQLMKSKYQLFTEMLHF